MLMFLPHECLVPLPELPRLIGVKAVQHLANVNIIPLQQSKESVDLVDREFSLGAISSLAAEAFMLSMIRVWGEG